MPRPVGMIVLAVCAAQAAGAPPRELNVTDYAGRLRTMWLGQCIANWTGLRTEGRRIAPPFYTDTDWGMVRDGQLIDFVLTQNPWLADDDTDIEYVYLHDLSLAPAAPFTPTRVRDAWIPHINRYIWVSNAKARSLMGRGVTPPMSGALTANDQALMIDAQLTTEFFGLLCPGMPDRALSLADPAIRATSTGYASHAAQFNVVLYSLAPIAPESLPIDQKLRWMYDRARAFVPSTSKTADIADFVLADFLANPDKSNWEFTRDRVYQRYMANAAANGFRYRAWYESSVNFAGLCAGLLYGQGDYKRTVQICTLWGWDSDNATATLGGLLGFMLGPSPTTGLSAQFPGTAFSDRFNIDRTRDAMPDYLPLDPDAQDTLTGMAGRMLPIVQQQILAAGGVDVPGLSTGHAWILPPALPGLDSASGTLLAYNPLLGPGSEHARSANRAVIAAGGTVTASTNVFGSPQGGQGATWNPANFANALEHDAAGHEFFDGPANFMSTQNGTPPGGTAVLSVTYDRPVQVRTIRFIEGDHFNNQGQDGGWFTSLTFWLRINGQWVAQSPVSVTPLDPAVPFQVIDAELPATVAATGVRISGPPGGLNQFITIAELDALAPGSPQPSPTFDLNHDGKLNSADLTYILTYPNSPECDLDGDGMIGPGDSVYLRRAIRLSRTLLDIAEHR